VTAKSGANSAPSLNVDYRPLEIEREVRDFWEKNRIQEKLMEYREKNNVGILGWVEGTANIKWHTSCGPCKRTCDERFMV